MITSIEGFLRYFDGIHRRAARDIAALPPEADGWTPRGGEGERAWSINTLVGHLCGSRLYFASAYSGRGWVSPPPADVSSRDLWLPRLEESATEVRRLLEGTPDGWLQRKIPLIDSDGAISGWRVLMMMIEHEVHHRSQIDTYASLCGWPVPDIFGRSAETVSALQDTERARHGLEGPGHPI
jgi:uncharacterized damage-inducible protein DinB